MIALILKATLILIAGWGISLLLLRRSAALRHLVWTATLGGVLLLAVAQPVLPELPLRVLPPAHESVVNVFDVIDVSASGRLGGSAIEPPRSENPLNPAAREVIRRISTTDRLLGLWILGILTVTGWCVLGRLGLARLLRRSTPLDDPEWNAELLAQRATNNVQRPVRLFLSGRVGSPVTWAIRHPVIVLPPEALDWTAERRQVVLAHELAHIARGDGIANLIAWAACAVYWFHPLAWYVARRQRAESERAADDLVLARGVSPVDYAAHLLDVARGSRWLRLQGATAIGMARPQSLEGRLLAVLDSTRNRMPTRAITRRSAWLLCAGFTLPLAALIPTLAPAAGAEMSSSANPVTAEPPQQDTTRTIDQSFPAQPGGLLTLDFQTGAGVRIEGWDQPKVQIKGELGGANWRETLVMMGPYANGIRIATKTNRTTGNFSTNHYFDIRVPNQYDVQLSSAGGDVTIVGLEGSFNGTTGGGEITIENARGSASLSTGGGDVRVRESTLDGRVSTGGGEVLIDRVKGNIKGSSGSGPVMYAETDKGEKGDLRAYTTDKEGRISVSQDELHAGVVHISKAGGEVHLERAPHGAVIRTGGGDVQVGRSEGQVRVTTGGGNITLGPVHGSVDATTGAGTVTVTVTDPAGSIDIGTGNGAAIIELPAGYNGQFELETAYTRTHGRTRIESDWDLTRSETDEWDSSGGTPRKYVRAVGKAGNGPGLIKVRITNGDITIRRR